MAVKKTPSNQPQALPKFVTDGGDQLDVPPHSIHAEQSLLGAVMIDPMSWGRIADKVSADDFYSPSHQLIFQAITELASDNITIDIITVSEKLQNAGTLEKVGTMRYVFSICNECPTAANDVVYAKVIRDYAIRRRLISAGTEIVSSAFRPEGKMIEEILDAAERKILGIADQVAQGRGSFQSMDTLVGQAIDRIETLAELDSPITGLSTGFIDFDEKTAGLQPSDLIIIAGRPSMGKTAFAINIAANAAMKKDKLVAVFSMEMPADAIAMRLLASTSRIDQQRMRTGKLLTDEWEKLTVASATLRGIKIFIDDSPALSPLELRARARRIKHEHKDLALIVIDYLQLMQSPDDNENRTTEIAAISRSLKSLAKELKVPVMALSQLNRSLESRTNKRPIMSDLRESGAIEQDADLVVFIYRDEVYNDGSDAKGMAEIIIAKQRNGPIGTVNLVFRSEYTRFENYTTAVY